MRGQAEQHNQVDEIEESRLDVSYLQRDIAKKILGNLQDYAEQKPRTFALSEKERQKTFFECRQKPISEDSNVVKFRHEELLRALDNETVQDFVAKHRLEYFGREDPLLEEIFRLRYKQYCEERWWEQPNEERKEEDEYDGLSNTLYVWLQNKSTRELVWTSRMILKTSKHDTELPVETIFDIDLLKLNNYKPVCEISRLCKHPKEKGDLIVPTIAYMNLHKWKVLGVNDSYMIMEPRLAKLLKRQTKLQIEQVTETIEYKSEERALYKISPKIAEKDIKNDEQLKHLVFHLSSQNYTLAELIAVERYQTSTYFNTPYQWNDIIV